MFFPLTGSLLSLQLTLEPLQYLCHHPQEPVYVGLPLDTHPFVFLRYRDCIPDTLRFRRLCFDSGVLESQLKAALLSPSSSSLGDLVRRGMGSSGGFGGVWDVLGACSSSREVR